MRWSSVESVTERAEHDYPPNILAFFFADCKFFLDVTVASFFFSLGEWNHRQLHLRIRIDCVCALCKIYTSREYH